MDGPFEQGLDAFYSGNSEGDNPYSPSDSRHYEWAKGFNDAKSDSRHYEWAKGFNDAKFNGKL